MKLNPLAKQLQRVSAVTTISMGLSLIFPCYAMAQDHTVQISGTLEGSCSFETVENGELVFTPEDAPTVITSEDGGTSALVRVVCNSPTQLNILAPEPQGGTPAIAEIESQQAWLTFQNERISSEQGDSFEISPGEQEIEVDLEVVSAAPLEVGTYTYSVTITATP